MRKRESIKVGDVVMCMDDFGADDALKMGRLYVVSYLEENPVWTDAPLLGLTTGVRCRRVRGKSDIYYDKFSQFRFVKIGSL